MLSTILPALKWSKVEQSMASQNNVSELVTQAWNHQREGRAAAAVSEFEKLVKQHPQDVDVNYGLGLSQKAAGQTAAAISTFRHTLEIIGDSMKIENANRSVELENVKTPEDDRLMMLQRMVKQRLAEAEKS
jgi:tetratricopeptide (TPR) repeat protein